MKWYFLIFAIIVVSESAKKNSISRLSIPLKSRAQNGYLRWLKQDTSPLKFPGVANGIQRVIKRAMRDLRVPFRANRPADNRPMRQSPQHGQTPIKAFSHPKLQPVLLSEVQSQQQQHYYPAYGTNHGSGQQSTRTHNRYNQQEQSRLQPPRRPMRLPNNDGMPRHPPMYNSQNSNSAAQQRAPFRQSSAASIPVPSLQSNPSLNRFPQNINGKAINPTPQMHGHPQKNRVIDVYHHIPVTQRPNQNMYPNVPLLHESQPLVSSHNQPSIQKFPSQANRPMSPGFISSEPVKHHHNHRQSQPGIAPQRFPGSEHQNANRFPPRSAPESYKNKNTNQRLPMIPPPNFQFQKENPFGQITPYGNLNKHQNIQKVNTEIVGDDPYDTDEDDDDQYKSGSQNIEESHLQSNRPKVPLRDFVSDDELRIVHTVEENPLNKTGTVKKYWDFRQENFGLTSSQTSKATSLQKSNISPVLAVSDQSKMYQDVKPVIMPPMKENINLEPKLPNGFSDLVRTIRPERLPAINDEKNMKYKNISKEFYHIDNKPKLAFEPIVDLPPQFMSIETSSIEQSTRSSAADSVNVPNLQNHKMHSDHNKNNFESSSVPEPAISSKFLERIPIFVVNKSSEPEHTQNPKYLPDINQNHNGNTNSDPVLQWSHDIKYIPAEIFRKNSTMNTGNGYHSLRDSFSDVDSLKTHETLPDHSVAPFGINVRNKAQYQKFEDTTTSAEYPIDVEDESSETEPRKYFRGPQHINNNWTIFEEHPVTNFAYRRLISTSIPYFSSWIASATTAMPHETVTRHMLQDNSQSMSRKIINAWNLANKVLGRRNNTRLLYPSLASSTEKPESKRLKFTYSPLPGTSAERVSDVLANNNSKRFFNFRTGTTQSVLDSIISAESKFTENTPKSSELPITDESKEFDKTTSSPRSNERFSFNITSNANRALERINARRNQSMASKGDKRPYYINLKPVTRPYSSSVTNYPAVVSSEKNTNPSSVFTVQMTTKSPAVSSTQKYTNPPAVFSTQKYTNPLAVFSTQKYTTPPAAFSTQKYTNPPVVFSTQKYTNPPAVSSTQKYTNPPAVFSTQKYQTTESESKNKSSFVTESTVRKFTLAKHKPMFSSPTTSPKRESTTQKTPSTKSYRNIGLSTMYATPPTLPILSTAFEDEVTTPPNTEGFSTEPNTESIIGATLDEYVNPTEIDEIEAVTETEKHYATKLPASPSPNNNSIHETATEMIDQEQLIVDTLKSTKIKMQEMMSKGLRHLMPMVMGLSSDVSISSDCTFSLLRWLRGIRGLEQWAIKMMDASSKIPEGILFGTFSTFGSYDECIAVETPERNSQIQFIGQYCSINIQPILPENERQFTIHNAFRRYPKLKKILQEMNIDEDTMAYYYILKHRIGLCIPSTCTYEDVQNATDNLANHLLMKISIGHCETSEKPKFTKGQIISMFGVFTAFAVVIIGTTLDFFLRHRLDLDMDIEEIVRKKSILRQFSYAFSAYRNACKILNTSIPSNHVSALHGIKFLSMTWIMLGHVYYCKDYLTLAGLNRIRDLGSNLAFQVILNTAFAADTFFFLSGLLVVYSTFQYLENTDGKFTIVGFYIKRYCRLTPAFLMISGVILLGPLIGSGPIWNETLEPFVTGCENYWWTNLFYFSNFIPTAKTCVPHGWFLSCDMQFYFISPVIILGLYRRPRMGMLLIAIGIIVSMASAGFLTFLYDLPPVSLFSLPDQKDINEYLDTMGYKPYAHYVAYCIGMGTGFLLSVKQKIPISKILQICGWSFAVTSCTLIVYGTWDWNSGNLPDWSVSVAYATCCRAVWALGIAWLTVICFAGYGGIINNILSWPGFIPLSRLSYLAYLIHPLLMYLYASYVRSPFYFSQYVVVYLYFGHLCVTFGLAFLFSLTFELPFLNLEKIISKRLDQSRRKRRASFTHYYPNWQHPEYPEIKDSVVLMRRRTDRFNT